MIYIIHFGFVCIVCVIITILSNEVITFIGIALLKLTSIRREFFERWAPLEYLRTNGKSTHSQRPKVISLLNHPTQTTLGRARFHLSLTLAMFHSHLHNSLNQTPQVLRPLSISLPLSLFSNITLFSSTNLHIHLFNYHWPSGKQWPYHHPCRTLDMMFFLTSNNNRIHKWAVRQGSN